MTSLTCNSFPFISPKDPQMVYDWDLTVIKDLWIHSEEIV